MPPQNPNDILGSYDSGDEPGISGNFAWDAPAHHRPSIASGGLAGSKQLDDERNEPAGDPI